MAYVSGRTNYFSLNDILASQERVPVTNRLPLYSLGDLDPSCRNDVIDAGTSLELPFWLAAAFSTDEGVVIELPKYYKTKYREILAAGASLVNLHKLCKYYFEFGRLISFVRPRDAGELRELLIQTFKSRHQLLNCYVHYGGGDLEKIDKFDSLERALHHRGRSAIVSLTDWLYKGVGLITTAAMVVAHQKRTQMSRSLTWK